MYFGKLNGFFTGFNDQLADGEPLCVSRSHGFFVRTEWAAPLAEG
jgi:hypothetical protein